MKFIVASLIAASATARPSEIISWEDPNLDLPREHIVSSMEHLKTPYVHPLPSATPAILRFHHVRFTRAARLLRLKG